jgi:putative oxidoreductase
LADWLGWLPTLVARVTMFGIFAVTGWGKLINLPKVTSFFTELGIPWPHFNAVMVGGSELICGVLLLIGLFTRLATIPLIVDMAIALATAKAEKISSFFDLLGQEEFVYIVVLLWVLVAGAGAVSIDGSIGRMLKSSRRTVAAT